MGPDNLQGYRAIIDSQKIFQSKFKDFDYDFGISYLDRQLVKVLALKKSLGMNNKNFYS